MKIVIIKNKNKEDYKDWSIWTCDPSEFDWEYTEEEHCYVLEGEVIVEGSENTVAISKGDYVIFPKGLKCFWKVIKPIKKHYIFK